ncbi:hypothetical protein ACFLZ6_01260, partial [Nanoarchaeota archaeon]
GPKTTFGSVTRALTRHAKNLWVYLRKPEEPMAYLSDLLLKYVPLILQQKSEAQGRKARMDTLREESRMLVTKFESVHGELLGLRNDMYLVGSHVMASDLSTRMRVLESHMGLYKPRNFGSSEPSTVAGADSGGGENPGEVNMTIKV